MCMSNIRYNQIRNQWRITKNLSAGETPVFLSLFQTMETWTDKHTLPVFIQVLNKRKYCLTVRKRSSFFPPFYINMLRRAQKNIQMKIKLFGTEWTQMYEQNLDIEIPRVSPYSSPKPYFSSSMIRRAVKTQSKTNISPNEMRSDTKRRGTATCDKPTGAPKTMGGEAWMTANMLD